MFLSEFKRLANWLIHAQTRVSPEGSGDAASAFEFDPDPMWHGDHWQNLLSSPMDARRYVMEDWSVSTAFEFSPASRAAHGS